MNYLRGAVSAISAPYQYYKDINPSTLTGAIDVIVISRPKLVHSDATPDVHVPAPDGERELACSPFHVRFGKWQVLRPADKKVNVFVNGALIPFSMKIGDAGEAFFVFETDEDIPENIATSPLLEATKPGETGAGHDQRTGRFGAKEGGDAGLQQGQDASATAQEPDFLDLDADTAVKTEQITPPIPSEPSVPLSPKDLAKGGVEAGASVVSRATEAGKAFLGIAHEVEKSEKDKLKDKPVKDAVMELEREQRTRIQDTLSAMSNSRESWAGSQKGDEALQGRAEKVPGPEVTYGHDMVFDMEGYHSHNKERSDRTVTSRGQRSDSPEPTSSAENTPGPSRSASPDSSPSQSQGIPFPRATSEPPPDLSDDELPLHRTPQPRFNTHVRGHNKRQSIEPALRLDLPERSPEAMEEYSWEWGNFPQKTPVWSAFDRKGKRKELFPSTSESLLDEEFTVEEEKSGYGSGGVLTVDRRDPTKFRVFIEGRSMEFELSLVPIPPSPNGKSPRIHSGSLGGRNEVEDAELFEKGRIDFNAFLQNEEIVKSDNLVLCLFGERFITRQDGSPLMDALSLWRQAALNKAVEASSRPVSPSPLSDSEDAGRSEGATSGDEGPRRRPGSLQKSATEEPTSASKPSSTSWVRWWSRRTTEATPRPELRPVSTEPAVLPRSKTEIPQAIARPILTEKGSTESAPVLTGSSDLTPTNSTLGNTVSTSGGGTQMPQDETQPGKRFAKTLRLTSDQLKSLDLKPGANTITFSLSATGAAACTARIFVWDYTDAVVISDIDGTITKSDALGHVFTMIGRDWTHLGVAKLYTDIFRNGYKIMYLTSRAIGQADSTRDYLRGIKQNDYQLPEGPVIMSPDRLMASLHREVIMRKPEVFKMACLRDIQRLFGPSAHHPFYAGFGNRITDALSYRSVNVPSSRIFTIDSTGEVKMELLELAGYKSSYIHMTDLVDQMFPPINRKWAPEYTDFNYWKTPMADFPLPDLAPPSPALSARSDTSNQSTLARLRHFSIGGRSSTLSSRPGSTAGMTVAPQDRKDAHLRQMSSLERLSSTLSSLRPASSTTLGSPRTMTPTSIDSESEDEEEDDLEKGQRRRRQRRRSVSSMPGSLPGSSSSDEEPQFGVDDEDEDDEGYGYEGEGEEEEAAEEAFDEDFLATGEMQNVPFL